MQWRPYDAHFWNRKRTKKTQQNYEYYIRYFTYVLYIFAHLKYWLGPDSYPNYNIERPKSKIFGRNWNFQFRAETKDLTILGHFSYYFENEMDFKKRKNPQLLFIQIFKYPVSKSKH